MCSAISLMYNPVDTIHGLPSLPHLLDKKSFALLKGMFEVGGNRSSQRLFAIWQRVISCLFQNTSRAAG